MLIDQHQTVGTLTNDIAAEHLPHKAQARKARRCADCADAPGITTCATGVIDGRAARRTALGNSGRVATTRRGALEREARLGCPARRIAFERLGDAVHGRTCRDRPARERTPHRGHHRVVDDVCEPEAHLVLCRVHVHVDVRRRHVEQHDRAGPPPARYQARVAFDDRVAQAAVADRPSVHEGVEIARARKRELR